MAMINRQIKHTFLEIKHNSSGGLINLGLGVFRTTSVYRNSAFNSEAQLMNIGDPNNDSMNDDIQSKLVFTSFGDTGLRDNSQGKNGNFNHRGSFNLPLDKITGEHTDGSRVKPSPRSKFAPGEKNASDSNRALKISPRIAEQFNEKKVLKYDRRIPLLGDRLLPSPKQATEQPN